MTAKPRRATYRHGNLKSASLKAATRLVAKAGHEQLSLREVADSVGVALFYLGRRRQRRAESARVTTVV